MRNFIGLSFLAVVLSLGQAGAATIYDESVNGDAPSSLGSIDLGVMALGTSTVIGSLPELDADGFGFVVAPGTQVLDLLLLDFQGPGGAFLFTPPSWDAPGVSVSNIGDDLLDLLPVPNPLQAGAYTFQIRTGTNINPRYEIGIVTSAAVPEPSTILLIGAGLIAVGVRHRRRS